MTALSVRLPESMHAQLKEFAAREGVSINQVILVSLAEKMARTEDYLALRAARASKEKFDAAMALISDAPPLPGDELP